MKTIEKTNDRWEQIVALVDKFGYLSVSQLSEMCLASEITIRRDLEKLARRNRIQRTHGGAASQVIKSRKGLGSVTAEINHSDPSFFDRLDVLVASDFLPKFTSLIQRPNPKKKVPVIAESLPLPGTETYVSVDNYQAGYDLGCWAGEYARQHWDGRAKILDLTYHRPNTEARSKGFLAGLRAEISNPVITLSINSQSRVDLAYQLTRDALSVHPDINLIFTINDASAVGAYEACKDLGIPLDQLVILPFGIEGRKMMDLMMRGEWIRAGLCMFPEIVGLVCVEAAIAAYNHQSLPAQLITPYKIVTCETLSQVYEQSAAGWSLRWDQITRTMKFPLPLQPDQPDLRRSFPECLGFLYTFTEHDWYKSMAKTMQEYTSRLGIQFVVADVEQTLKDELYLRRVEIARRAAKEVNPGDTILIDAGPISKELAAQLSNRQNITVITNSLEVLDVLKEAASEITLICIGGAFRSSSQVFVGPTAEAALKVFHIDKLFLVVTGVSRNLGLYHTNISEVTIKQLMIRAAREVILLADYSCFQEDALVQVAPISAVHKLITDDALPASVRLELGQLGISVILAST